ncbi:MAG: response regulator [Acidobacteria bacterium]|nr:response regulator [Acidobacteriota bacterium]
MLYAGHVEAARIRSGASLAMWLFALVALLVKAIQPENFIGVTACVGYLILINPPTLALLRRASGRRAFRNLSLLINFLEIIGYTAVIYFLGGMEGTYLTPIYAALIAYVAPMAPRRYPFIMAGLCAVTLAAMATLQELKLIPSWNVDADFSMPLRRQIIILSAIIALLFIVASIASYTAGTLRAARDSLREQNRVLEERAAEIEIAHKRLRDANDELERRVAERTEELERSNTDLRGEISERRRTEREKAELEERLLRAQKMEALGLLAGGVAHDLNNVLTGIVAYPELLLSQVAADSPLRRPLTVIQNAGSEAAAIVQDLLALARRGVVRPEILNLNRTVHEYLDSQVHKQLEISHPRIVFRSALAPDLKNVSCSPVHLLKTIMNLVSNAAEAQPMEGEVTVRTENRTLDRDYAGYDSIAPGEYVVLTVSDRGAGISREDLGRIFEPFYTKKVMGRSGTGLGLSVVWGTVRDHHGRIDVQTGEGKGTSFELYFPASSVESADATPSRAEQLREGSGERILIVDDAPMQREIGSEILERLGYVVESVASGEEAVEWLTAHSADLVVLDMIMDPGIDGRETFMRMRKLNPDQRVVIVSGFSETEKVIDMQRLGAGAYVRKPYTVVELAEAVRGGLAKRHRE